MFNLHILSVESTVEKSVAKKPMEIAASVYLRNENVTGLVLTSSSLVAVNKYAKSVYAFLLFKLIQFATVYRNNC